MAVGSRQLPLAITANTDTRFDNFFSSEANKPTVTALQQFTANASETVFYLWGNQGSGISHLLQAAQNCCDGHSQYLPLPLFLDYPAAAITEGLEQVALLCVDDIQVIAGTPQWEEAVFYLFNRLRETGGQLVVGSHRPPRELSLSLPDLHSRLQWGGVFQLHSLTDSEKQQALQFVAQHSGLQLTEDVAHYILTHSSRSPGFLFELMRRLDDASLAQQRRLTIPFVKSVLGY